MDYVHQDHTSLDHFYSMIRGSLTEPRRKPNHDDEIWGFCLSVKLADLDALRCPRPLMIALLSFCGLEMEESRSEWFLILKSRENLTYMS
ncbi:hypothetical protein CEXT_212671 [Caerostris extrusa]|uniref:Uncharacterized protein n=1 Tax=Caerostris extrusa TaxID=172846 RepID=A0AAV4R453_CAEEX|nr:hypothetical protein CEXT_212671 [Caerostris extrusa]